MEHDDLAAIEPDDDARRFVRAADTMTKVIQIIGWIAMCSALIASIVGVVMIKTAGWLLLVGMVCLIPAVILLAAREFVVTFARLFARLVLAAERGHAE